jgi:hypothetical protein
MADASNPTAVARDILERAALVHRFDPLDLMPPSLDPKIEAQALALVAQYATEVEFVDPRQPNQPTTLWRLNPPARRSQLNALASEQRLDAVLKNVRAPRDDMFARYLREALSGALKPDAVAAGDRDSAAIAADFAAEALGPEKGMPAREAAGKLRSLLSQKVDEQRSNTILGRRLIGRADEQKILDAFVASGEVPDQDRLPEPAKPMVTIRPYLLTGVLGAGKSALVADLVRRRRGYPTPADESEGLAGIVNTVVSTANAALSAAAALIVTPPKPPPPAPVVLLDFDRGAIALGGEFEWLAETTRQLGYGRSDLAKQLSDLRAGVRRHQAVADPTGKLAGQLAQATAELKNGLASALGKAGVSGETLVLVLDTFEEVLVRSPLGSSDEDNSGTLLGRILIWADSLATLEYEQKPVFAAVRVIASGREKLAFDAQGLGRWFIGHREIVDLKPEDAINFLRQRDTKGIFSGDRAKKAVERVGGHPLTLDLLVRFAQTLKREEIDATISKLDPNDVLASEVATRVLYSRILERFHHDFTKIDGVTPEMVRAVAHPGLVLRVITPELLREVICPACGIVDAKPETISALFERLSTQMWLVEPVPRKNAVRHRPDVRRLMLPMMAGDSSGQSQQIRTRIDGVHRRAAVWFDKQTNDSDAPVEALYHRAFLSDGSLQQALLTAGTDHARELCRRVAQSAGADIRVMPVANRALLRYHDVGAQRLSQEEFATLPPELKRQGEIESLEAATMQGTATAVSGVAGAANAGTIAGNITELVVVTKETLEDASIGLDAALPDGVPPVPQTGLEMIAPPVWMPGPQTPERLLDMIVDRELTARIGFAFNSGDFDTAARLGWEAIAGVSAFPDLSERLRVSDDPVMHWFWQTAMASLVVTRYLPPRDWLENCLRRFAASVDPRRGQISSAGVFFAAATTVALGGRLSPETVEACDHLATLFHRARSVETHCDLRVIALSKLWQAKLSLSNFEIRIPYSRLQLFAMALLGTSPTPPLDKAFFFSEDVRKSGITSRDADKFVMEPDFAVSLSTDWGDRIGPIVAGVAPEIHDSAIRALIGVDTSNEGALNTPINIMLQNARFWPVDLRPNDIPVRDRDRRAGMIAGAVVHADRCGLLPALLEAAQANQANVHLQRIALLARRYDDVRRRAYGRPDTDQRAL